MHRHILDCFKAVFSNFRKVRNLQEFHVCKLTKIVGLKILFFIVQIKQAIN